MKMKKGLHCNTQQRILTNTPKQIFSSYRTKHSIRTTPLIALFHGKNISDGNISYVFNDYYDISPEQIASHNGTDVTPMLYPYGGTYSRKESRNKKFQRNLINNILINISLLFVFFFRFFKHFISHTLCINNKRTD